MVAYVANPMSSHPYQFPTSSPAVSSVPVKKLGQKVRLPNHFTPQQYAVLCGRGSKCTKSPGNERLRQMVNNSLQAYSEARNKVEKTAIVSAIIHAVKQAAPNGAFVKYEGGSWWEVEDDFAREKIGCLFRDSLHHQYRSSTKAKLARKKGRAGCDDSVVSETSNSNPSDAQHHHDPSMMMENRPQQITSHSNRSDTIIKAPSDLHIGGTMFRDGADETVVLDETSDMTAGNATTLSSPYGGGVPLGQGHKNAGMFSLNANNYQQPMISHKDLSSLFGTSVNQGRTQHRHDFMRECLPPGINDLMMSSTRTNQASHAPTSGLQAAPAGPSTNGIFGNRQSQTSSLLRVACDIVGGPASSSAPSSRTDHGQYYKNVLDTGDFPDDMSDIFEDEDDDVDA